MADEEDFFNSPKPANETVREENSESTQSSPNSPNLVLSSEKKDRIDVNQSQGQIDSKMKNSLNSSASNSMLNSTSTIQHNNTNTNSSSCPSTSISTLVSSDRTNRISLDNFNFSDHATIHICETERRVEQNNSINSSTFVTYLIEVRPINRKINFSSSQVTPVASPTNTTVPVSAPATAATTAPTTITNSPIPYSSLWRRFSEFDQLRDFLIVTYPHVIVPVVPCKTVARLQKGLKSALLHGHKAAHRDQLESPMSPDDPLLLETRKTELERFLTSLMEHKELKFSEILWSFLQDKNEFCYKLKSTGYNARLSALGQLLDQTASQAQKLTENTATDDLGRLIYARCGETQVAYRNFIEAYTQMSLAEFSSINVYENFAKVFSLLSEIEITLRKELSTSAPKLDSFITLVKQHQDYELKEPLSRISEIERVLRKSLKNCQEIHYRKYQNEVKYAQMKLDETKLERTTLSSGSIPKNITSLRGFGSMLKAVVETNYEREARGKKLERREQLEEQLVDKTNKDFLEFKNLGFAEILNFEETRQAVTKLVLRQIVENKIELLRKSRDTWQEIYDELR